MIVALIVGVGAIFGTCQLCKLFTAKDIARDNSGVPHDEHDSAGVPLTGWKLKAVQVAEAVFNPICGPLNKLLGRK